MALTDQSKKDTPMNKDVPKIPNVTEHIGRRVIMEPHDPLNDPESEVHWENDERPY